MSEVMELEDVGREWDTLTKLQRQPIVERANLPSSFAIRDWAELPLSKKDAIRMNFRVEIASAQMVKFLKWVEKDGLVTPREFRRGRGLKVRQDAILQGFVVLKGNRHTLTEEGIRQLAKPPAVEKAKAGEQLYADEYRKWAEGGYKGLPPKEPSGVSKDFLLNTRLEIRRTIREAKPERLRDIHSKRTPLSRASDERQSHQVTISADSPKTKAWEKDQGTADIQGIDTPTISKRSTRISRKTPRISPKAGRLR